ncbi:MAG: hypothetical protein V7645_1071 [Actinomycetota bacterium]|jgi:hypothetical protein
MTRALRILRRRSVVVALVAAAVVAVGGTALAGLAGSVRTFTGCLSTGDGVIVKVKEGDQPKSPCSSGQTLARLSGGDITKVSVTGGLTLPNGGDSGDVTISLDPKYSLPQGCGGGEVAKWNDTTGAWECKADADTTYSSGTGLSLIGTTFGIAPDYRIKNTPDCDSGTFATGFDSAGEIQCAAPAATGVQAYAAHRSGQFGLAGEATVLSKTVPAGTYLIFASVELYNEDDNDTSRGWCSIPGYITSGADIGSGGTVLGYEIDDDDTDLDIGNTESLSLTSSTTLGQGGSIELKCTEAEANVDVAQATLVALKVGSLG